jgi:hypothetical protein
LTFDGNQEFWQEKGIDDDKIKEVEIKGNSLKD